MTDMSGLHANHTLFLHDLEDEMSIASYHKG
jgi:hypothetical protein